MRGTALLLAALAAGCGARSKSSDSAPPSGREVSTENLVTTEDGPVQRTIGDDRREFAVVDTRTLAANLAAGTVAAPTSSAVARLATRTDPAAARATHAAANETGGSSTVGDTTGASGTTTATSASTSTDTSVDTGPDVSLAVGFPVSMLGESHIFGGVITKVSNRTDEDLGMLKLSDLPSIHVDPRVVNDGEDNFYLALYGCLKDCTEFSRQELVLAFPILGVDEAGDTLFVDLADFGRTTNLAVLLSPDVRRTYTTESSATTAIDYSYSTLVFDVASVLKPNAVEGEPQGENVTVTARWYMRAATALTPFFTPRAATKEVGFFTTSRSQEPLISRFSLTAPEGFAPVKYFFKTVPADVKDAFAGTLTAWNDLFEQELGRKLLEWEFIEEGDARSDALVPGDIRYNVIEWDLVNAAPYGGLGPSIAAQSTGQILSANVLVQGPAIVQIYREWFRLSEESRRLRDAGEADAADQLFAEGTKALMKRVRPREKRPELRFSIGNSLPMRIPAQLPAYDDAAIARQDFFETPAGETYESYMKGYWHDLLGHELGHNLGLRHNFRGNLGSTSGDDGKVSRSIMEYLNRTVRHKDSIGPYDRMAIQYGYRGARPIHNDWFCTDEDVIGADAPTASAECSRDDLSADPYGFFKSLYAKALDQLTAPTSAAAPNWTVPEMSRELGIALTGLISYAATADDVDTWTNFAAPGRPRDAEGVIRDSLTTLRSRLCGAIPDAAIAAKATEEAKTKVRDNLAAARELATKTGEPFGIPAALFACP